MACGGWHYSTVNPSLQTLGIGWLLWESRNSIFFAVADDVFDWSWLSLWAPLSVCGLDYETTTYLVRSLMFSAPVAWLGRATMEETNHLFFRRFSAVHRAVAPFTQTYRAVQNNLEGSTHPPPPRVFFVTKLQHNTIIKSFNTSTPKAEVLSLLRGIP